MNFPMKSRGMNDSNGRPLSRCRDCEAEGVLFGVLLKSKTEYNF